MLTKLSIFFLLLSCMVLKAKTGTVYPKPCDFPCTREWDPVCGTDCKTYGNRCEFRRGKCLNESLEIKHTGECVPKK